jgi:abortive infection bacteriophage resistance protein
LIFLRCLTIINSTCPARSRESVRVGFLFMGSSALPGNPYTKAYKTPAQQVLLLQSRGLEVLDSALAQACLERIGYYRLSGYWYPFRKSRSYTHPLTGKQQIIVEDDFRPNSTFQQVMDLYVFDKRLRLIFLDAIERIEVALRVDVALLLGKRSLYAHRDPTEFNSNFGFEKDSKGRTGHDNWLDRLDDSFRRSNEEFVTHFKTKYHGQYPPIWVAIELWDFGMLSFVLNGLKVADQTLIARKYGLRPSLLISFARNINNIRNICAHHSRLWNRSPVDRIASPRLGEVPALDHLTNDVSARSRVYATAAVMQHFLSIINPSTRWPERFSAHLKTLPATNGISLMSAGFPAGWEGLPLWKNAVRLQPAHDAIANRAFCLWEERGKPEGQPMKDWFRAERELLGKA